jgi:hypothetical protein
MGQAAGSASSGGLPELGVRAALWGTIPAALATELGALAAIGWGLSAAVAVGLASVVVLGRALRREVPESAVIRVALVFGGPPLRYGLLLFALWHEWAVNGSGVVGTAATAVVLAVIVPMIGGVLAAPRSAGDRHRIRS